MREGPPPTRRLVALTQVFGRVFHSLHGHRCPAVYSCQTGSGHSVVCGEGGQDRLWHPQRWAVGPLKWSFIPGPRARPQEGHQRGRPHLLGGTALGLHPSGQLGPAQTLARPAPAQGHRESALPWGPSCRLQGLASRPPVCPLLGHPGPSGGRVGPPALGPSQPTIDHSEVCCGLRPALGGRGKGTWDPPIQASRHGEEFSRPGSWGSQGEARWARGTLKPELRPSLEHGGHVV